MRHTIQPASKFTDDPRLEGYVTFHGDDPFEEAIGPFCWKEFDDGTYKCAFVVERRHLNDDGMVHGGCLMSFADFAIFRFSTPYKDGPSVTLSFECDFTSAAFEGDFVECTGEVVHSTGSFVFLRGDVFTHREGERVVVLSYKATIKKFKKKP